MHHGDVDLSRIEPKGLPAREFRPVGGVALFQIAYALYNGHYSSSSHHYDNAANQD
jgi:hypothetical protein